MLAGGSWDQTDPGAPGATPRSTACWADTGASAPREVSMSAKQQLVLANHTPFAVLFSTCQIPPLFLKEGYTQNRG